MNDINEYAGRTAVRYLRVSTKSQVEQYGLDVQDDITATWAADNQVNVVSTFTEKAVSGKTELDDREAWALMLDYVTRPDNTVQLVVIPDLSRLARDLMIQETLLGDIRKRGLDVISVREPDLCADDPSRKLIRQIIGAINEYDRSMIVLRLRLGRSARAKSGERGVGRLPMGYRMTVVDGKHVTEIDPAEAEIVQHVYRLRNIEKWSLDRIANWLNDSGYRPKGWSPERPSKFHNSTINKILKTKLYGGNVELRADADNTISVQNDNLRILDNETK